MNYKSSKYNFIYKRNDDEYVIYNTYSKAIVTLNQEEYKQYLDSKIVDESILGTLLKNQILIDKDFDEEKFLTYCHNVTKYSKESLHLVIATTMDCNFGCPYCYENRRKGKMSTEVQNAIINFIEKNLNDGIKTLDVTWYGGEPLLYPDIVENMSKRIHELVDGTKCQLNMYMVTNGYLLTEKIVQLLDDIGVLKVQITLDGLKESHDRTRHLKNGDGSFDRIYKNLSLFDEYPIHVDIRTNVDNHNFNDFVKLKDKIAELENKNITVYPSPVEDINHDTINEVSKFMSYDEFEKFAKDIYKENNISSAKTSVLNDRYCYCQAETENNYVIDELGNCYKCWDEVGRIENSCFNILNPSDKNYKNVTKFMCWNPYSDSKCKDCVFLPICFGGCKFHRINTGKYDCGFTEETMKEYLEDTYFKN